MDDDWRAISQTPTESRARRGGEWRGAARAEERATKKPRGGEARRCPTTPSDDVRRRRPPSIVARPPSVDRRAGRARAAHARLRVDRRKELGERELRLVGQVEDEALGLVGRDERQLVLQRLAEPVADLAQLPRAAGGVVRDVHTQPSEIAHARSAASSRLVVARRRRGWMELVVVVVAYVSVVTTSLSLSLSSSVVTARERWRARRSAPPPSGGFVPDGGAVGRRRRRGGGGGGGASDLIDVVVAREDRLAVEQLGEDAADRPHVDRLGVLLARQHDLGRAIPATARRRCDGEGAPRR